MTNGTSQGLFIVVAIVIFGIFVGLSYTLFGSEMGPSLLDLFNQSTEKAENSLQGNIIDENNNGEVDPEDSVNISDATLKTEIVKQLESDGVVIKSDKITVENMEVLDSLTAVNKGINDLNGLETATNLKVLDVSLNNIKSVAPITKLSNLVYLNVEGNPLSDFKDLEKMNIPNLKNVKYTSEDMFVFNETTQTITDYLGTETNIVIPSQINGLDVKEIGSYAFSRYLDGNHNKIDVNIDSVVIPDTVEKIGNYAFVSDASRDSAKQIKSVNLGSVKEIGQYAFARSLLTEVTIPDSVIKIGDYAFAYGFVGIEKLHLGSGVETIGTYAFSQGKFKELELPNSLKSVGYGAFLSNSVLEKVYAHDVNTSPLPKKPHESPSNIFSRQVKVYYEQPYLFNKTTQTITDYWGYDSDIVIPSEITGTEVKKIGAYAFSTFNEGSNNRIFVPITSVVIPDTVVEVGVSAFRPATNLTTAEKLSKLTLGNSVSKIGKNAFEKNNIEKLILPDSLITLDEYAFSYSNNLKELVIGKGLIAIPKDAFNYNLLEEVYIPENVLRIAGGSFTGSTNLKSFIIDNSKGNVYFDAYAVKYQFTPTYLK